MRKIEDKIRNLKFNFTTSILTESMHVADGMDELSFYIARCVKKIIKDFGLYSDELQTDKKLLIQSKYDGVEYVYSGWNFDPNYKETFSQKVALGEVPSPVNKLDNENIDYPVYYKVVYNESISKGGAEWRILSSKNKSKIYIQINACSFMDISKIYVYNDLITTISHELQHVFDMYIIDDKNPLDSSKYGAVQDLNDNEFKLPVDMKFKMKMLLTLCTPEEIRGRLAELKQCINLLSKNKKVRDELFAKTVDNEDNKNMTLNHEWFPTEKMLIDSLMKNKSIKIITRSEIFKKNIDELRSNVNKESFGIFMLMLGYYMNKHIMIKMPTDKEKKLRIRNVLSDKENIKKLWTLYLITRKDSCKEYADVIDYVYESVLEHYYEYVKQVGSIVLNNIHKLYTYKKVSEVYGDCGFDDCVILYKDSDEINWL